MDPPPLHSHLSNPLQKPTRFPEEPVRSSAFRVLRYHELFVSTKPEDRDFDNQTYHQSATEYLGKLPDDEF